MYKGNAYNEHFLACNVLLTFLRKAATLHRLLMASMQHVRQSEMMVM
mgnify:CR=1 FL=1